MDYVRIGEYGRKSDFRISDIETGIKEKTAKDLGFITVALTAITSLLLIPTLSLNQKAQEATKPRIENVDSIANKAKAIQPILEDSFKFGKKIIIK
jgi:hypothetical protein